MIGGAILQKRIQQAPVDVLPLQYVISLLLCLAFVPFRPFTIEPTLGFLIPLLWMGLVISVGAQLLLYRLIQTGNLVTVTSLFYLLSRNRVDGLSVAWKRALGAELTGYDGDTHRLGVNVPTAQNTLVEAKGSTRLVRFMPSGSTV